MFIEFPKKQLLINTDDVSSFSIIRWKTKPYSDAKEYRLTCAHRSLEQTMEGPDKSRTTLHETDDYDEIISLWNFLKKILDSKSFSG